MSVKKENQPSTSRCSPPSKKIKVEDEEENVDASDLGYVQPPVIKEEEEETPVIKEEEEVKQEIVMEEIILKEESEDDTQTPSTSSSGTQTDYTNDVHERKANEAVKKLLAELQPQKKVVRGPFVTVTDTHVLQFLITLMRGKGMPKIWRRFKVPASYTFRQFHVAIQKVMGWKSAELDYHLHAFKVLNPVTGYVDSIVMSEDVSLYEDSKDESVTKISDYFKVKNHKGRYEYDFGCGWQHEFVFENLFVAKEGETYPKCMEGAKACPPEDGLDSDEDYDSDEFNPEACF